MTKIQIKRVYDPDSKADGFRVLVDKLWPRGVKKENLHYDYWAKEIAPSTALRQWFHQDQGKHWTEFREKYIHELNESPDAGHFLDEIKRKEIVTLLYASKNGKENHALVLQEYLTKHLK
ncbi:MAG: DUF488 family protein [Tannerella sp.]|jgi:uncharacterized protein YeaO (DUF488 family)|nr:DUF488 family protein [Tannerella sp.]